MSGGCIGKAEIVCACCEPDAATLSTAHGCHNECCSLSYVPSIGSLVIVFPVRFRTHISNISHTDSTAAVRCLTSRSMRWNFQRASRVDILRCVPRLYIATGSPADAAVSCQLALPPAAQASASCRTRSAGCQQCWRAVTCVFSSLHTRRPTI